MRLEIHYQARCKPVESVRIDVMQRHDGALVHGSGSLHARLGSECWCAQLEPFQTVNAGIKSPHPRSPQPVNCQTVIGMPFGVITSDSGRDAGRGTPLRETSKRPSQAHATSRQIPPGRTSFRSRATAIPMGDPLKTVVYQHQGSPRPRWLCSSNLTAPFELSLVDD